VPLKALENLGHGLANRRDYVILLLLIVPTVVSIASFRAATTARDAKDTANATQAVTCEQAKLSKGTSDRFRHAAAFIRSFETDARLQKQEDPQATRQFLEIIASLADEASAGAAARAAATEETCSPGG
jgi:hypothetical protein